MYGLFMVVDRNNPRGLEHWADELYARDIPALVLLDQAMPQTNPALMRNVADMGFEIGCVYNDRPVWDLSHDEQWGLLEPMVKTAEDCLGKKLNVIGAKFFSYNEATLQIAQKLGIRVIPVRGTTQEYATVYKPNEYDVRIMSVSNVPSASMGTGSLCDWSLYSRSEAPTAFRKVLMELTAERIVLVSQTHLGGVKQRWWAVYQEFLNTGMVDWQSLANFTAAPLNMPLAQIPQNREAQYHQNAKPVTPLDKEPGFAMDRHNKDAAVICVDPRECGIC